MGKSQLVESCEKNHEINVLLTDFDLETNQISSIEDIIKENVEILFNIDGTLQ